MKACNQQLEENTQFSSTKLEKAKTIVFKILKRKELLFPWDKFVIGTTHKKSIHN